MITITLDRGGDPPTFTPGETISGSVSWADREETESIEIRLIWYTIGKGDRDAESVDVNKIVDLRSQDQSRFSFVAPHRPNSFAGQLIAIQWAIEVIKFPQRDAEQGLLEIHPVSGAVKVTPVADGEAFGKNTFWNRMKNK